ncbi:hypothetical protein Tco_0154276 [Tanacetum coccineum]
MICSRGRAIDTSFYQDMIQETLEKFNRIGFECLLNLDEEIYPRFIMKLYKTLRLDRYLEDNRLFMTFDINGREFNISLDQFAKLTSLLSQGICLYSGIWSLDQLENSLEQVPPYNSNLLLLRTFVIGFTKSEWTTLEIGLTKCDDTVYHRALPARENMSDEQRETRGMFKNMARAFHTMGWMLKRGCH